MLILWIYWKGIKKVNNQTMFKKHKIKNKIFFSVIFLVFSFCFFVISTSSFANDENVDKITNGEIDSDVNCNAACLRLSEAIEIKADVADEKENAYNQAINHIKWWLSGLGIIAIAILTILGVWRNNTLESARKTMEKRTEKEIETIREMSKITLESLKISFDAERSEEVEELKNVIYKTSKDQEDLNREKISKLEDQLFQILLNNREKGKSLDDYEDMGLFEEARKSVKDKNEDPFA